MKRGLTEEQRFDYLTTGFDREGGGIHEERSYYDISYLLNASLWDRYFLSTIETSSSEGPLNPNQIVVDASAVSNGEPDSIAASLIHSGMFNVNSTSISAWKAFLASSRDLIQSGTAKRNTFPRSLQQPSPGEDDPTGTDDDSYGGVRLLSDDEIDTLARQMVRQVRLRGPFVSMAQFVNRALGDVTSQPEMTRAGALQVALDEAVNMGLLSNNLPFSGIQLPRDRCMLPFNGSNPVGDIIAGNNSSNPPANGGSEQDWTLAGVDQAYKTFSSILSDREIATNPSLNEELGFRSTSIPGWVNQADVLQLIGPSMNVRSDTFKIRTCGRAHDTSGNVIAVAYAEAIVQRSAEFLDPSNDSDESLSQLSMTNQRFGRRFDIVSFRWLRENEI